MMRVRLVVSVDSLVLREVSRGAARWVALVGGRRRCSSVRGGLPRMRLGSAGTGGFGWC